MEMLSAIDYAVPRILGRDQHVRDWTVLRRAHIFDRRPVAPVRMAMIRSFRPAAAIKISTSELQHQLDKSCPPAYGLPNLLVLRCNVMHNKTVR